MFSQLQEFFPKLCADHTSVETTNTLHRALDKLILDLNSSVSETYG